MTSFSGTLGANNLDNDSTRNHPWPSLARRNLDLVSSWQHSFLPLNRRLPPSLPPFLPPPKQQSKLLRAKTADDGRSSLCRSLLNSDKLFATKTSCRRRRHRRRCEECRFELEGESKRWTSEQFSRMEGVSLQVASCE